MRIQIDTKQKSITIEEDVDLGEFVEFLKRLFPREEWRSFKLEVKVIVNWAPSPILVPYTSQPLNPWDRPLITYGSGNTLDIDMQANTVSNTVDDGVAVGGDTTLVSGVFSIETN